jgi:hypothetical protein
MKLDWFPGLYGISQMSWGIRKLVGMLLVVHMLM